MSVNVFLHRYTVHVPSVARARILPTVILRRPMIYIDCYNGRDQEVVYPFGAWDKAKKDFETLEEQMRKCNMALAKVSPVKMSNVQSSNQYSDSDDESNDMK